MILFLQKIFLGPFKKCNLNLRRFETVQLPYIKILFKKETQQSCYFYFNLLSITLAMALTFGFYTLNLKIPEVYKLKIVQRTRNCHPVVPLQNDLFNRTSTICLRPSQDDGDVYLFSNESQLWPHSTEGKTVLSKSELFSFY